jgi:hypothetical protein
VQVLRSAVNIDGTGLAAADYRKNPEAPNAEVHGLRLPVQKLGSSPTSWIEDGQGTHGKDVFGTSR